MRPNWTLRQVLALLRGLAIMVALFWMLVLLQLVPALIRKGVSGVHERIARVAVAGVPPEQWNVAVTRMYTALGATLLFGILLYLAQRYLGRKLAVGGGDPHRS
ncbi:MAG TPA: hypothetical protein VLT90_16325 [Terriglobales bacterium]|nr:hypothetical protein [Terriglobales bacterium]